VGHACWDEKVVAGTRFLAVLELVAGSQLHRIAA
jgi:hypothetical protein